MPALIRNDDGNLLVTFGRDGEDDELEIATTGKQALDIARRMLAKRDELRHGDLLSIWRCRPERGPATKGPSHA
jgi:hypothetical protein